VGEDSISAAKAASQTFPVGGGELGELIRHFDWSKTSLGPIEAWPQCLKTATDIALQSPLPLVMLWGTDGIMIYNDPYSEFAGQRHPRLLGSKVLEGWVEVADFNAEVMRVGLAGGTLSFKDQELTLYRNNRPEQVWMDLNYSPVMDEAGEPAGVLAIVVETTSFIQADSQRAKAEEHLRLVINELNHRVKNNLAMIQAIGAQTFRNTTDLTKAQNNFASRLQALAKANDLLTGEHWVDASLQEAIRGALQPHRPEDANRCIVEGPPVRLTVKTAISLSMAFHELATNAVKYGAWSNDEGKVSVTWKIDDEPRGRRLHLEWRETGGPAVAAPDRRGFGLAAELEGEVKLTFEPEGLACRVDAPLKTPENG
jgi:two-component sensor histidine kinase